MNSINTNWNVITGGPCTGKTTMIELLGNKGYKTTIEHARHYIDTQQEKGNTVEEIRSNKIKFQHGVLQMQIDEENSLDPNQLVFLDRAIPDAEAYYNFLNIEYDELLNNSVDKYQYRNVFILDRLPLINDYARIESLDDQIKIHRLITRIYENGPSPVIYVPVLSPKERLEFILNVVNRQEELIDKQQIREGNGKR